MNKLNFDEGFRKPVLFTVYLFFKEITGNESLRASKDSKHERHNSEVGANHFLY